MKKNRDVSVQKADDVRKNPPDEVQKREFDLPKWSYMIMPFLLAGVFWMRREDSPFDLLWYETAVLFAYIAAVIDYRTRKIPNFLIIYMFFAWVCILVPQLFIRTDAAMNMALGSALGFVLAAVVFGVVYVLSRGGLGGGDVKYMSVMGLFLGYDGILFATLVGSVILAVTALILLLLKKMGRKDTLPMAPFLFVGILITVAIL